MVFGNPTDRVKLTIAVAISGVSLVLLVVHLAFGFVTVEPVGLALFGIAVAPWLTVFFTKIEILGTKFEAVRPEEVQKVELALESSDVTVSDLGAAEEVLSPDTPTTDYVLASAELRFELERALRELYGKVIGERPDLGRRFSALLLTRKLTKLEVIAPDAAMAINRLFVILNKAAHRAPIEPSDAELAQAMGANVILWLRKQIENVTEKTST